MADYRRASIRGEPKSPSTVHGMDSRRSFQADAKVTFELRLQKMKSDTPSIEPENILGGQQ
jgi:hypothetical protein